MDWLRWFGRWGERDQVKARLESLREDYGGHGDRVIRLSARTDLARKSAGSTQRAFAFVESAFAVATQEYARINDLFEGVEAGLARGKVGNLGAIDQAIKGLGPKLDDLERQLATWEAKWQQTPREIDEAERTLAALRVLVEQAVAAVGAPLPLSDRLASMESHLERCKRVLAEGNPVEAGHLVGDLQLSIEKVGTDVSAYVSGASAITQAEQEIAQLQERLAGAGDRPEAVAALTAAAGYVPGLRPALAAGRLEQFQADLLQLQRQLGVARAALR
ncbi:MAG: hypothetical protein K0R39_2984 [Symbiobacteriaceae bacterium]|jgi:chromosome segregation ATPase|nr:hypothetical protein [Symbiobacteriaceae bacterium]